MNQQQQPSKEPASDLVLQSKDYNLQQPDQQQHEDVRTGQVAEQPEIIDLNLNDLFLDENYSIENLLKQVQKHHLRLSDLRERLCKHQQDLTKTSLDLFNNSYDRFYKLSYIVACLSEPIQLLVVPLQNFRDQLAKLCQNHDAYIEAINAKLFSLEDTCKNKELAKRLIVLIKRRDRVEKQFESIDWSVKTGDSKKNHDPLHDIAYTIKCDLLERINIELYHLISEVRAIQPTHDELIAIKKLLELNLNERQSQLDEWFEKSFLDAVESRNRKTINLIMRVYKQKGSVHKLDHVWRMRIAKPFIGHNIGAPEFISNMDKSFVTLTQFLDNHIDLIGSRVMAKSFWEEVINKLEKMERLYTLNELETFHKRYLETKLFLDNQEQYKSTETSEEGIDFISTDISKNRRKILDKFNLKGYFNHRLLQIASSIESTISQQPLTEIPIEQDKKNPMSEFRLKICMHVYALIKECWSPDIFIDDLELSFLQLSCRIINRFAEWLSKLRLSDFRITGSSGQAGNKQTSFLARQDAIMRLLIEDCNRLSGAIRELLVELEQKLGKESALVRRDMITESLNFLDTGLGNVRSLQHLIER